jgi:outer membrane protein OmpA-like peptidoglycan-associated protein
VKTQIFMGPIDGSELNPMPFSNAEYSDGHPAISDNGKTLIFSSDRPGGQGGLDLWMSVLENGKWSEPQNLGADINTEGDEAFPFLDWYGKLYFASNGHPGLGGLDVLVAESSVDSWTAATNLGFPVNSSSDDFGLIWDRDHSRGVFASNREGGAGSDDLYTIERLRTILAGEAFDAETGERLKGVTLRYGDQEVESNEEGRFEFDLVRSEGGNISAEFDGYLPFEGDAEETGAGDRFIRLELQRGRKFEGVALNDDGAPLAGTILTLMDDLGNVIAETEAMDDGSFSFEVLNPDADREFVVVAEKDGFSDAKFEALEAGSGTASSMEVVLAKVPDCSVFKPVYFDQNRHNIRDSEFLKLELVIETMREYPELRIELSSHTDSNWSHDYNDKLSAKRTYSVARWLWDHGVETDRIVEAAHGENKLTNDCEDGVDCTPAQHQANRRTEFRCLIPELR